jgi:hypothetical protein
MEEIFFGQVFMNYIHPLSSLNNVIIVIVYSNDGNFFHCTSPKNYATILYIPIVEGIVLQKFNMCFIASETVSIQSFTISKWSPQRIQGHFS